MSRRPMVEERIEEYARPLEAYWPVHGGTAYGSPAAFTDDR
jgi:hypothetical protein